MACAAHCLVIASAFTLSFFGIVSHGQSTLPNCTRGPNWKVLNESLKEYCDRTWDNHIFWAASNAPISQSLSPAAAGEVDFFAKQMVEVTALALKKRQDESLPAHCTTESEGKKAYRTWVMATATYARTLALPYLQSHCLTRVVHSEALARTTTAHLRAFAGHLVASAKHLAAGAQRGTRPASLMTCISATFGAWSAFVHSRVGACR